MTDVKALPEIGSFWQHVGSEEVYCVELVTNVHATKPEWPVTIVYQDAEMRVWSRPAEEWHAKFRPLDPEG